MKKSLALLGLLIAFSQPVSAQCCHTYNQCNPCLKGAASPVTTCNPCNSCCTPCNPCLKIVPISKTCVKGCALIPCDPCNPCATGAAVPVTMSSYSADPEYQYCCQKHIGFWRNFFSF